MSHELVITARARQELAEIARKIAIEDPAASLRLTRSFETTMERVIRLPRAVSFFPHPRAVALGLRRVAVQGFPNHLVFFSVVIEQVRVVRVLHGARDLTTLLRLDPPTPEAS